MKLYWVEGSGFVITSANLSASALEPGGHHEIGWFETDWRKIEMPALIRSFGRSRSLTIEELARMHRLHDEYWRAHPVVLTRTNRQKPSTYSDWHAGTQAQKWKLTWWDDPNAKLAASTRKHLKEVTGTPDYEGFMDCEEGQLKRCDWLLTFRVTGKVIKEIEWMYIDCVHKLTADERRESGYACQAVQLKRIGGQVRPPFDCKSANFQTAFREVAKKCFKPLKGEWKTLVPPTSFLNELARRIKGSSTGHFGSARRKALP